MRQNEATMRQNEAKMDRGGALSASPNLGISPHGKIVNC